MRVERVAVGIVVDGKTDHCRYPRLPEPVATPVVEVQPVRRATTFAVLELDSFLHVENVAAVLVHGSYEAVDVVRAGGKVSGRDVL
jgi:hypothetical protein